MLEGCKPWNAKRSNTNTPQTEYFPVLIVHGTQDATVPLSNSQKIFELLQTKEKELFIVDGADHSMKEEKYAKLAYKRWLGFLKLMSIEKYTHQRI